MYADIQKIKKMTEWYANRKLKCPGIVYYSDKLDQIAAASQEPNGRIRMKYSGETEIIDSDTFIKKIDRLHHELGKANFMYVKLVYREEHIGRYI